jgi:hypothetical protein
MAHYYIPMHSDADTLGVGYKSFTGDISITHHDASTQYFGPTGLRQNVADWSIMANALDDYPLPTEAAEKPPIYIRFLVGIQLSALGYRQPMRGILALHRTGGQLRHINSKTFPAEH